MGCCGFSGSMKSYFEEFKVVEIQRTFYKIPRESTLEKWKIQAPEEFEFTIKATQLITHPSTSPTYKKANISVPPSSQENYGFFRPTEDVFSAWKLNKRACDILNARICIFQTPKSFRPTDENLENMRTFFKRIERGNLTFGWEPRGKDWTEEIIKNLCKSLNLTHVTDPFKQLPIHITGGIAYFRLHGSPPGKKMYSYKYTEKDFTDLVEKLKELENSFNNTKKIYVMFNNIYMRNDAKAFSEVLVMKKKEIHFGHL